MAKKITGYVKLQIPAGEATPAPPVGPALGPAGRQHHGLLQELQREDGVAEGPDHPGRHHGLRADRSYTFITKTPPAAILLLQGGGSRRRAPARRTRKRSARSRSSRSRRSPRRSSPDLNAADLPAADPDHRGAQPGAMGIEVV